MHLHGRINDKTRPAQPLSAVLVGPSCTTPTTNPFESPKANTPAGLSMARAASASSRPTIPKAIIDVVTCGITRSMQPIIALGIVVLEEALAADNTPSYNRCR